VSSTSETIDVPADAAAVAQRYHRLERLASGGVALLVAGTVGAALLFLPLLAGVVVALTVVALLRVPVVRSSGTVRLVADGDPAAVEADFESATPPLLAFQWGIADDISRTTDGASYEFSSLFGLRSVSMETEVRSAAATDDSSSGLELAVTEGEKPWANYAVTVDERETETVVNVEWTSERRFGLRRLPQWLVAERYRTKALTAQGYTVVDRDASLSL
jgi:hypothetical protein